MKIENNTIKIDRDANESGYGAMAYLVKKLLESYEEHYGDGNWVFQPIPSGTYLVYFESKYKHEKEFSKDFVLYEDGSFDNDFDEGQNEYRLIGITPISEFYELEPHYEFKKEG